MERAILNITVRDKNKEYRYKKTKIVDVGERITK